MDTYQIKLTFLEPILGTVPKDPEVYEAHVQSKAADLGDEEAAQEISTIERVEEKGWTGFHTIEDGAPVLYDYVIKGFFKDACGMLRRAVGTKSSKLRAYKKVIDGLVFISPRQIPLNLSGQEMGVLERPLRAQTARGERIALARSDICPAGTTLEFNLQILGSVSLSLLEEWLDYGKLRGLGQWRNAGYGVFVWDFVNPEQF